MDARDEDVEQPPGWIEDIPFESDEMLPLHVERDIRDRPESEWAARRAQVPANIFKKQQEEAAKEEERATKHAREAEDVAGS